MKLLLVGVSCVGKSKIGKLLAYKINHLFFDFDKEIEKHFNSTISFIQKECFSSIEYREKTSVILENILKNNSNYIVAMCPAGLKDYYYRIIKKYNPTVVCITDTAKNILKRITFYDEYSRLLDITLSEKEKILYLKAIKKEIRYYKKINKKADYHVDIAGLNIASSANKIIEFLYSRSEYIK